MLGSLAWQEDTTLRWIKGMPDRRATEKAPSDDAAEPNSPGREARGCVGNLLDLRRADPGGELALRLAPRR